MLSGSLKRKFRAENQGFGVKELDTAESGILVWTRSIHRGLEINLEDVECRTLIRFSAILIRGPIEGSRRWT